MTAAIDLDSLLEALAAKVADHLAARMASPANAQGWQPVAAVATRLGWTTRRTRTFCREHGVRVAGTRKAPLVDVAALDAAIAGTARTTATTAATVADLVRRRTGS